LAIANSLLFIVDCEDEGGLILPIPIKAELEVNLILLLAEYGYPPVANDDAYKEILEQAENFKRNTSS